MNRALSTLPVACFALLGIAASPVRAQSYEQTNLVSDVPGLAATTDPDLKNPWGVSFSSTSPFWVSDQVTGLATLYNSSGAKQALTVTIPGGDPTGQVFNSTSNFVLPVGGKSTFIFATLNGTIDGWNGGSGTTAQVAASTTGGAFTGLALGNNGTGNFLYAANDAQDTINVFNITFQPTTLSGSFTDPSLPIGFKPYNIQNMDGKLYVTYTGQGGGAVVEYDLNGNFLEQLTFNASGGPLDNPWGMAIAPSTFGTYANDLLVGNEGNGRISAFNPTNGAFLGQLTNQANGPIVNTGLWALNFGNGGSGGSPNDLYFAAGINGQTDGLFGSISFVKPVPEPGAIVLLMAMAAACGVTLKRRRLSR